MNETERTVWRGALNVSVPVPAPPAKRSVIVLPPRSVAVRTAADDRRREQEVATTAPGEGDRVPMSLAGEAVTGGGPPSAGGALPPPGGGGDPVAGAATTPVAADVAVWWSSAFSALTATRSVLPRSADAGV